MSSVMILENDYRSHLNTIPRWHFSMLNDFERNVKFKEAISSVDLTNKLVLDIGTGSGFLSMLAVQQGAKHVYTCESNYYVAEKAKQIIDRNGFSNSITVINKLSTDLIVGIDLPDMMDVLISETVDCGFFGEGFGISLIHAKKNLLKDSALIIPESVKMYCALLSSSRINNLNSVPLDVLGLDLTLFNDFKTPGYFPVRLNTWEHSLVTESKEFLNLKFSDELTFSSEYNIKFTAHENASVHGVVFWFELGLTEGVYLTNSPSNHHSHWMQVFQNFQKTIEVINGNSYIISCSTNQNGIDFYYKYESD